MEASTLEQGKHLQLIQAGFRLDVTVAPDQSSCLAHYSPAGGPILSDSVLHGFLKQAGITTGVRENAVSELLLAAAQGKEVSDLLLAEGTPMKPGTDGRISLYGEKTEAASVDDPEADGQAIDFRQVQDFFNVEPGDALAVILPPGEGTPGVSIFGAEIPATPGRAVVAKFGKNVAVENDGVHIVATGAGRVFCNGSEISVDDVYQVKGDVDFNVGNIDFNGYVEVSGDILDGFKVRASKGIKILGNVGACSLSSDGDIAFSGMNGQGVGKIQCGGSLSANYIYESDVEVAGELLVEMEIRLCEIKCLGSVIVKKGGIVGGECVALAGVEVGSLGSITSINTGVAVGVNYQDLAEMAKRFKELEEIAERQKKVEGTKAEREASLRERAAITALIREIRARKYERANAKINVRKVLFGGVRVSLDMLVEMFREERSGPFTMIENKVEGGMRFLDITDLSVKANDLEEVFQRRRGNPEAES
jgi:uncharacterized protein